MLTIESDNESLTYPFDRLKSEHVLNDQTCGLTITAFFDPDALNAFQSRSSERIAGAPPMFNRNVGDQTLRFEAHNGILE
ncbi:MAG: hypothetical protein HQ478_05385 [Chloroflexi bacterium]|nr:hypothetical protein [Chloroflexota bacterium]